MRSFPNTNGTEPVTKYSDFKKLIEDWNVSEHFKYRMRKAITSKDKVAEFTAELLSTTDMRFIAKHGYELNVESMTMEV